MKQEYTTDIEELEKRRFKIETITKNNHKIADSKSVVFKCSLYSLSFIYILARIINEENTLDMAIAKVSASLGLSICTVTISSAIRTMIACKQENAKLEKDDKKIKL